MVTMEYVYCAIQSHLDFLLIAIAPIVDFVDDLFAADDHKRLDGEDLNDEYAALANLPAVTSSEGEASSSSMTPLVY